MQRCTSKVKIKISFKNIKKQLPIYCKEIENMMYIKQIKSISDEKILSTVTTVPILFY